MLPLVFEAQRRENLRLAKLRGDQAIRFSSREADEAFRELCRAVVRFDNEMTRIYARRQRPSPKRNDCRAIRVRD